MRSVAVRDASPGVLVVDDDALTRAFLRDALEADARIVEAADGDTAIAVLSAHAGSAVNLVLADYVLPGRSGLEILEVTRRRWPWIPVVIVTAFGSEDLAVQALRAGASDYLRKPLDPDVLVASVRALTTVQHRQERGAAGTSVDRIDELRTLHPGIRRAVAFVREHFADAVPLAVVAREAALSRFHFCRLFRRETGIAFHDYVHELRVRYAKALLADRQLTVTEVAYRVGFNDLSHFDRTFRRLVGASPTEYRASLRCA